MPNRIIKDNIRSSESLGHVSAGAERLFYRLVTSADDYGRFDGRVQVVRNECFKFHAEPISDGDVAGWLQELVEQEVIQFYEVKSRRYGYFMTWQEYQRVRAKESKFPPPPPMLSNDNTCSQTTTYVAEGEVESRESKSRVEDESRESKSRVEDESRESKSRVEVESRESKSRVEVESRSRESRARDEDAKSPATDAPPIPLPEDIWGKTLGQLSEIGPGVTILERGPLVAWLDQQARDHPVVTRELAFTVAQELAERWHEYSYKHVPSAFRRWLLKKVSWLHNGEGGGGSQTEAEVKRHREARPNGRTNGRVRKTESSPGESTTDWEREAAEFGTFGGRSPPG